MRLLECWECTGEHLGWMGWLTGMAWRRALELPRALAAMDALAL